jgi:hypothetical protein
MSSLARSRNSPIFTRFTIISVATILGYVNEGTSPEGPEIQEAYRTGTPAFSSSVQFSTMLIGGRRLPLLSTGPVGTIIRNRVPSRVMS